MSCVQMKKKNKCSGESSTTTIESLPDSVLSHILSFIPTKEAVTICLLSWSDRSRWRELWRSLSSLHFDETHHTDFPSFRDFTYNVLLSLKYHHPFQSLTVSSGFQHDYGKGCLRIFLYEAWKREIQQLDLRMTATSILLPDRFYRIKTLVTLKLYNVTLDCSIRVDFPLLKSLILIQVVFTNRANMFKFFSACPNLEDLDSRSLTILSSSSSSCGEEEVAAEPLPKLVTAKVSYSSHMLFPLLSNAQFLRARMDSATINYVENPMFHRLTNIDLTFASDCCNVMTTWLVQMLHNSPKLRHCTIHKESSCPNQVCHGPAVTV